MKKSFLLAAFLLHVGVASAVQYEVVCCDGTKVYTHGVSEKSYLESGATKFDVEEYRVIIGTMACKNHGNCVQSVTELPESLSQNVPVAPSTPQEVKQMPSTIEEAKV